MRVFPEPDRRWTPFGALLLAAIGSAWPLAVPAQPDVYVYPAGCFDAHGRPLEPDPANPAASIRRDCRPPEGDTTLLQGSRTGAKPADGAPSMQPGSINLPPTPVPVPGGIGVMNP
jgi:hypothetical protein